MDIVNHSRGITLAARPEIAVTWSSRLLGLMFRRDMPADGGLILAPCNSIHTCFMKFKIDVLFVNREGIVLHIIENMPPFRFSRIVREAAFVIELPSGTVALTGTGISDRVSALSELLAQAAPAPRA